MQSDTIVAVATARGRGGVGIVRMSGPLSRQIGEKLTQQSLKPRFAHYTTFSDRNNQALDEGIALYFAGPNSFTGEDVFEFQGHGGPVILDLIVSECLHYGARQARPGEFSERAFLNDKMDLVQAEAVADLIDASSEQAARNALKSLQGKFSSEVHKLVDSLIHLRMYVEAAIDFPEEEIDFLADGKVTTDLKSVLKDLREVLSVAGRGAVIRDGMRLVIAGRPNVGKSSLLNCLAGYERAIVTDIEGTTRDILSEQVHIDGMPLHIIDTAGLRDTADRVEQIGIERAWKEVNEADLVVLMLDAAECSNPQVINRSVQKILQNVPVEKEVVLVINKSDLRSPVELELPERILRSFWISARNDEGVDIFREFLKDYMGYQQSLESTYSARRRHLICLEKALSLLESALSQMLATGAGELLAEDLRIAQETLSEITGEFSSDDLLGKIFSSFCIGK